MAPQHTSDASSHLTGPVYAVGLLFVALPIVDTLAQAWPPSFGNPSWRYGTVGLGANYLISVLFGLLLISLVASYLGQRRALRWLTGINVLAAVVSLLSTLGFVLDALQVRPGIPSGNMQAMRVFDIGAEKAVFKYVVTAAVLLWLAFASWRAAKAIPHARADEEVPKLVSHGEKH